MLTNQLSSVPYASDVIGCGGTYRDSEERGFHQLWCTARLLMLYHLTVISNGRVVMWRCFSYHFFVDRGQALQIHYNVCWVFHKLHTMQNS